MKKLLVAILTLMLVMLISGCGISQEKYDSAIAQRDELVKQIEEIGGTIAASNVKNQTGSSTNNAKIKYEVHDTKSQYVVVTLKNTTGKYLDEIKVEATFYKNGSMLSVEDESFFGIPIDRELAYALDKPEDDLNNTNYDKVEINIKTEEGNQFKDDGNNLKVESNKGVDDVLIKFTNIGDNTFDYIKFQVVYYKSNNIVGCEMGTSTDKLSPKGSGTLGVQRPYDYNLEKPIDFDGYKVLLVESHI